MSQVERAQTVSALKQRITEIEREMDQLRPEYERAKALTQSPAYVDSLQAAMARIRALLGAYTAGEPPDKAVYILGRMHGALIALDPDLAILNQYEALRERRRKLAEGMA